MGDTPRVCDQYETKEEFEELLDSAERQAVSDWEIHFVSDMQEKFEKYGTAMYFTNNQKEHLERLANK